MFATFLAAALISQCPGGTCPPQAQFVPVPQLFVFVPAQPVPDQKEVQVLSKETVTVTETVRTTQKRASGLIGRGVILKPLFGIRAGRQCSGSCTN